MCGKIKSNSCANPVEHMTMIHLFRSTFVGGNAELLVEIHPCFSLEELMLNIFIFII